MNSQLISEPDFVTSDNIPILLINADTLTLKLVIATCETVDRTFDIYVCGEEANPEWFSRVLSHVDKVFKKPTFDEVFQFIKDPDEGQ